MSGKEGTTNCQTCIDCQRMIGMGVSWRCYGRNSSFAGEVKRDICFRERPPRISPDWCPHRERNIAHKE